MALRIDTPAFARDPYPAYANLRQAGKPVYDESLGLWLVARHADVVACLGDRRFGRALDAAPGARPPASWPDLEAITRYVTPNLLEREGPDHARIRRALSPHLRPARLTALRPRIEATAKRLVAALPAGQTVDFIAAVAEPLPIDAISRLLGWPEALRGSLRPWAAAITRIYEPGADASALQAAELACAEFADRISALVDERRARPGDDLLSALAALPEDELGGDELIASAMLLLNAGHDATVNAAGNGLAMLLAWPQAEARWRAAESPDAVIVEEMLRFDAPLHLFHRYALDDFDWRGIALRRGDRVGLLYGAANRDGAAFAAADVPDVARTPNRHLAFGAATHFCLGAPLARLELGAMFEALRRGTRRIEADGPADFHPGIVFHGRRRLPIRIER